MKKHKLTADDAKAIIAGFKADGLVNALPETAVVGWTTQRIRTWLPTHNKLASDAIWDGNEGAAINHLLSLGLSVKAANSSYLNPARYVAPSKIRDLLGEQERGGAIHGSRGWGTVKSVRAKPARRHRG